MALQPPTPAPIGFPLLPVPDSSGKLNYPNLENSVRQSIQIILRTRPGEQLMRPDFGAGLANFLAEPNTITTRRRICDAILTALERWEQRIVVERVDVRDVPDHPPHVRVEILYRLKRTGLAQQLGLTMQLEV